MSKPLFNDIFDFLMGKKNYNILLTEVLYTQNFSKRTSFCLFLGMYIVKPVYCIQKTGCRYKIFLIYTVW